MMRAQLVEIPLPSREMVVSMSGADARGLVRELACISKTFCGSLHTLERSLIQGLGVGE